MARVSSQKAMAPNRCVSVCIEVVLQTLALSNKENTLTRKTKEDSSCSVKHGSTLRGYRQGCTKQIMPAPSLDSGIYPLRTMQHLRNIDKAVPEDRHRLQAKNLEYGAANLVLHGRRHARPQAWPQNKECRMRRRCCMYICPAKDVVVTRSACALHYLWY